jgi:hypothetical protein
MKHFIKKLLREALEPGGDIWYHGSNSKFDEFNLVDNRTYKEIDVPSWYFTKDETYAKSYGKYLYEVRLNIKKTFDTRDEQHMQVFINQLKEWGYNDDKIGDILSDEFVNELPYWTCNDAIYTAAAHGFDSIFVEEELEKSVIGISVFDAANIEILNVTEH